MIRENTQLIKLTPDTNKHLKSLVDGTIAEGSIYLGKYDSENNYVEVTEEEYQAYLQEEQNKMEVNDD